MAWACVLRASIRALRARPPENASAVVKLLDSFVNLAGLSRVNDAFSAPHRVAALQIGGKPSTTGAFVLCGSKRAFVLRASLLAGARRCPHFGATLETGGKPSTTDAFEFTNKNHRGPRPADPNQETSEGLSPARSAGDSERATARGRWGPSEREDKRPHHKSLRQRNLSQAPSAQRSGGRCRTQPLVGATSSGGRANARIDARKTQTKRAPQRTLRGSHAHALTSMKGVDIAISEP